MKSLCITLSPEPPPLTPPSGAGNFLRAVFRGEGPEKPRR